MGKVVVSAAVSLDGYIAGPNETGFDLLFEWFAGGDFEFVTTDPAVRFKLSEPDYRVLRDFNDGIGVYVAGRRSFDLTDGWDGTHPLGKPVVVVTHAVPDDWVAAHPDAPFTFVTDGVPAAVDRARAIAGDQNICVTSGK